MRKSRFSEEQIVLALRQAESGTRVTEICRKLGVSEATFYRWKKRYGSLGVSELRELKQLREENRRLKGLVADLSLDKSILQEVTDRAAGFQPTLHVTLHFQRVILRPHSPADRVQTRQELESG